VTDRFDVITGFASGPFQMLLGSTMRITTSPAHVTLPGLTGNRISAPNSMCWQKLQPQEERAAKSALL
jgi:hypothetical protein